MPSVLWRLLALTENGKANIYRILSGSNIQQERQGLKMLYGILQSNDPYGITDLIVDVCAMLRGLDPHQDEKVELPRTVIEMMVLTVAAESSFKYREQIGGGPARGLMGWSRRQRGIPLDG